MHDIKKIIEEIKGYYKQEEDDNMAFADALKKIVIPTCITSINDLMNYRQQLCLYNNGKGIYNQSRKEYWAGVIPSKHQVHYETMQLATIILGPQTKQMCLKTNTYIKGLIRDPANDSRDSLAYEEAILPVIVYAFSNNNIDNTKTYTLKQIDSMISKGQILLDKYVCAEQQVKTKPIDYVQFYDVNEQYFRNKYGPNIKFNRFPGFWVISKYMLPADAKVIDNGTSKKLCVDICDTLFNQNAISLQNIDIKPNHKTITYANIAHASQIVNQFCNIYGPNFILHYFDTLCSAHKSCIQYHCLTAQTAKEHCSQEVKQTLTDTIQQATQLLNDKSL